jgi:hypothetical protein
MSRHRSFATAIAVLCLASPLAAQASPDTITISVTPRASTVVARSNPDPLTLLSPAIAPAWTNVDIAPRAMTVTPTRSVLGPQSSESSAMMIVGGAGLLVGAIVGGKAGTVVMVGGGVLGLIGLWTYLR